MEVPKLSKVDSETFRTVVPNLFWSHYQNVGPIGAINMALLRFTAAGTKYMWKTPNFYLHVFGDGSSNGTYKFPIRLLYFSSGSVPNKNMHTCPGGSWLSAWETDLEAWVHADDHIIVGDSLVFWSPNRPTKL